MQKKIYIALLTLFLCILATSNKMLAQIWENQGFTPSSALAYDQNGLSRTVVTSNNIYRSTDGGATWQQMLSRNNAPFLRNAALEIPYLIGGGDGKFYGFQANHNFVFDDVIFVTTKRINFNSTNKYVLYSSNDGGQSLTESFVENNAFYLDATYGYDFNIHHAGGTNYVIRFISNGIAANGGDKASIYHSTDEGQNWSFLFSHPENAIDYVGTANGNYVFLAEDQLIYRAPNGAFIQSITLPESMQTGQVTEDHIRLLSWGNGIELRGYESTTGPTGPFTNSTTTLPSGIKGAQIFDDLIITSAGPNSLATKTYKSSFSNFNSSTPISPDGTYQDLFPYRKTSDGQFANRKRGAAPNFYNYYTVNSGAYFISPFFVSNDNLSSFNAVSYAPYALNALPVLNGNHQRIEGGYYWNTTDGSNYERGSPVGGDAIKIFEDAIFTYDNGGGSVSSDGLTTASNERYVVGFGNTLYTHRTTGQAGIYSSTDNGNSWYFLNNGYFWGREVIVDKSTGVWYGFDPNATDISNTSVVSMSRSTDQGQSWEFVPGTNFPGLNQEDYYYGSDYDFVNIYNGYFIIKDNTELLYSADGGASFEVIPNLPFELGNSKVFVLNGYLCVQTAAEQFFRVNLSDWLGSQQAAQLPGAHIDLSLTLTLNPPEPAPWQNFDVTYTITNSGTTTATEIGIQTFIASNGDAIVQGGTTPTYNNIFGSFGNALAAGESGSITYHYFRLDGDPIQPWGQLTNHLEPDIDSRPNNSSYPNAQEDDEVIYNLDPACLNDVIPPSLTPCPSDINVSIIGVDTFLQWELPVFEDNCPSYISITISPPETPFYFGQGTFPVGTNTLVSYTATDNSNNTTVCSFTITVNQMQVDPCSLDNMAPSLSDCPANINLTTTTNSVIASWAAPTASDDCTANASLSNDAPTGNVFDLGTTTVTYTATDEAGNTATCSFDVTVTQESDPGDGIDLNLSISQPNDAPSQWSSYSVIITILNEGSETATGVIVQAPKPDGVVYSGGNEYMASQGTFAVFSGANNWNVGTLNAGEQATLTVNYFLLVADPPISYTQVITANEPDADSTPNNGTCCAANEDDEASTDDSGPAPCENDLVPPSISCPEDIVTNIPGSSTTINWTLPSTSDNCSGILDLLGSSNSGDLFNLGTTNVSYTATDASGNTANCSFSITINQVTVNEEADLVPSNLQISNSPVNPGGLLEFTFDLSNQGTADAIGDFSIKAYISSDNILSADDIQDGVVPTGNFDAGITVSAIGGASTIPSNLIAGTYYLILVADAEDEISESDESNNHQVASFQVQEETDPIDPSDPCANVVIATAPGLITISNTSTPHRILKVFNPDWSTAINCLDDTCADPLVLSGLSSGTYFISIKLYDAQWQFICEIEDFYTVPAALSLSTTTEAPSGNQSSILSITPNPVYHGVTEVLIHTPKEKSVTMLIYNVHGQLAKQINVALFAGRNKVELATHDLTDGVYHIYIPGISNRNKLSRFIIARY